jgi:RNA polymerase sigma-70 factor (ECF subfamily)
MTDQEFAEQWRAVVPQVTRACRYAFSDPALSADVAQQVAVRAWRGALSFRGDCPFKLWVLKITRNEINRAIRRLTRQRVRETPLDSLPEASPQLAATDAVPEPELAAASLPRLVASAGASGELTAAEARCVLEKLERPQASWDEIGTLFGISGAHCAVLHCRAIPKLRAYLLMHHRDQIAPGALIEEAVRLAARDSRQPLTATEEATFRKIVLERNQRPEERRNLSALRAACAKVIRHLPCTAASPSTL